MKKLPLPVHLPRLSRCRALTGALALALLAGCATTPPPTPVNVPFTTPGGIPIDVSVTARGQDSRVLFLIIHYTVLNLPDSIRVLTQNEVSSHYLLTDHASPRIMRLVDEYQRAWHAGPSSWKGNRQLNASSIGIEIVHPGARILPNGEREYLPFPPEQINALIPLVQDIVKRHQIRPERILGHGEVTPAYKEDPGPTFPWKLFADLGITPPWPDAARVAAQRAVFEALLPDAAWFQQALARHGYAVAATGVFDRQTERVLMNFQMRYRPADYSGKPDAESAAILWVLTQPPSAAAAPVSPLAPPDLPDPPLPPVMR
jgi:N-acetylmuramoyl-L-alanine amidase